MTDEPTLWVDGLTLAQALARTVERHGHRDAAVFPQLELRWSYHRFQAEVDRVARALMALGVEAGEHVGIWSTNWPQWIVAQFATASCGAVLVNVNPVYGTHDFAYVLEKADITTLLLTDRFKSSAYEQMLTELIEELPAARYDRPLTSRRFPRLRNLISIKDHPSLDAIRPWEAFLALADRTPVEALQERASRVRPDMPVNVQYTSGTTGSPKGVMLSHRNLLMNAYYVGARQRMTERDRVCIPVPFYHCFGCVMGTLMCSLYGAAMVVPAEAFDADATLSAVEREGCTALYGVPTMFNAELHCPSFDDADLRTLRTGIMAGSLCPIELMRKVTGTMHLPELTIAYGLTEASPVVTQTEPTESLEVRTTTVGKALSGVEVRLVDPSTGRDVADGETGELWVRGHGVMLGYYKDPEATAAVLTDDGWLRSGDLARRTPAGHYEITGRIKDIIIRGGENISPREIEEFLHTHPKVRDVQVVGVPDDHYGEQVSAWIMPTEPGAVDADEIIRFCKGAIARFKVPRYVAFVDEYPMTVTGKIQKYRLREMAVEQFGLDASRDASKADEPAHASSLPQRKRADPA